MGKKSDITRAKIIETARALFLERGFDGLKMQELADRAGMNKGLLHYYFKSKELLFRAIFSEAFESLFGGVMETLMSDLELEPKLHRLVDVYFDKLIANPGLPIFILSEIHKGPSLEGLPDVRNNVPIIMGMLHESIGKDKDISLPQVFNLLFTVISLSVFPFAARPLLAYLMPPEVTFEGFVVQRKAYVKKVVSQLIEEL